MKALHDAECSVVFYGLENVKKYNVKITSVKNRVESEYSKILSFVYNEGDK